jgi:hypothetical protein
MSAFIIFQAAVTDPDGFARYAQSVPPRWWNMAGA